MTFFLYFLLRNQPVNAGLLEERPALEMYVHIINFFIMYILLEFYLCTVNFFVSTYKVIKSILIDVLWSVIHNILNYALMA